MSKKLTIEEFIQKAKQIHNNKYNYSLVDYVNNKTHVKIICNKCNLIFTQRPDNHLQVNAKCSHCYAKKRNINSFIKQAKETHGNKYDYSLVNYVTGKHKVKIICKTHGIFKQRANSHYKFGCEKCANDKRRTNINLALTKAKETHDNKYDYSLVKFSCIKDKVKIICKAHGIFEQQLYDHTIGRGCPKCATERTTSKAEKNILLFLEKKLKVSVIRNNRTIIEPFELDILLPDYKIAIEYNGIYWHSEAQGKDRNYHRNKTKLCEEKGYRLIHIYEDMWVYNKKKIKNFLKHLVGKSKKERIYARKTHIKEIDTSIGRNFLDKYHIQGTGKGSIYLGTFKDDTLVAVTSFTKGASNTKNKGMYELSRHATSKVVIGCLGKVTKFFAENYHSKIYTFCDNSFFDGNSYIKAGFVKVGTIPPDYMYVVGQKREHKFNWRRSDIKEKRPHIYSDNKSESEMMKEANIYRIWDCGKTRYEFML